MNRFHRRSDLRIGILLAAAVFCCPVLANATDDATDPQESTTTPIRIFTDGLDGPWIEPAGRKTVAWVTYPTLGVLPYPSHTISVSDFKLVLGDGDPRNAETVPFPGALVSLCINTVMPGEYISMAFTADEGDAVAMISAATYGNDWSAALTASVSVNPGDFSNAIVGVAPGYPLKKIVVFPYTNGVAAMPGETGYFNIRHEGTHAHMICLTNSPGHQL